MIHGFGGAGIYYYKLIEGLISKFKVIFIDNIGMGGSSRPDNFKTDSFTPQQAIDYYIDYIEQWRIQMKLTDFVITGHSMGGYLAGCYAVKYPDNIRKLHLYCPIGIRVQPEGEDWKERFDDLSRRGM